jgi:uncharacterized protein (TIGR02145 family)
MNKIRFTSLTASLVLAITFTISCEDKEAKEKPAEAVAPPTEGTFTDPRDGKKYKFVKIGEQVWMAENLNFSAEGSKCYDNKPENCEKYGRFYDWGTAMKACPNGWHLPNNDEYGALYNTVGGKDVAGKKLKAKSGWNDSNEKPGNGTDDFGFSALPSGFGDSEGFGGVGDRGGWWSATEYRTFSSCDLYRDNIIDYKWWEGDGISLMNVRCIQD